jgi:hypothetical protein
MFARMPNCAQSLFDTDSSSPKLSRANRLRFEAA